MTRSLYKARFYVHKKLYAIQKILERAKLRSFLRRKESGKYTKQDKPLLNLLEQKAFYIYKKSSIITPILNAKVLAIHDGLLFQQLTVKEHMFFSKIGEYVYTKRQGAYIHKDNKIARKKALKKKNMTNTAKTRKKKEAK